MCRCFGLLLHILWYNCSGTSHLTGPSFLQPHRFTDYEDHTHVVGINAQHSVAPHTAPALPGSGAGVYTVAAV